MFGRHRIITPSARFGSDRGGLVLTNPAAPLGYYVIPDPLLEFTSDGSISIGSQDQRSGGVTCTGSHDSQFGLSTTSHDRQPQDPAVSLWWRVFPEVPQEFEPSPTELKLRGLPAGIEGIFDTAAVRECVQETENRLAVLVSLTLCQLLLLFVALPLSLVMEPRVFDLITVLAVIVVVQIAIGIAYWLARRASISESCLRRTFHALAKILYPPAGLRATDELARHQLAAFHPLAVAAGILTPRRFLRFVRGYRRRMFSLQKHSDTASLNGSSLRQTQWLRLLNGKIEEYCTQLGLRLEDTFEPMPSASADARSYCPRCSATYSRGTGYCADCPDVELVALPASDTAEQ